MTVPNTMKPTLRRIATLARQQATNDMRHQHHLCCVSASAQPVSGWTTDSRRSVATVPLQQLQQPQHNQYAHQRHRRSPHPSSSNTPSVKRSFGWQGHGTDLLSDSLAHPAQGTGGIPKVVLNGHSTTGFDISNLVKLYDEHDADLQKSAGVVHLCGSIIALPTSCFLWNTRDVEDITLDSLGMIELHRPKLEYLFIGSNRTMNPNQLKHIKDHFKTIGENGIVVEQMDLTNAMGTFNILNGEDRLVAAALILEPTEDDDGDA